MRRFKNGPYPLYDVPDLKTLRDLVEHGNITGGDRPVFFLGKDNDIPLSFKDFAGHTAALGTYLLSKGFHEAKIAILGENSTQWCLAYFAIADSGNVVIPLDSGLNKEELLHTLRFTECSAIFYSAKCQDYIGHFKDAGLDILYLCLDEIFDYVEAGKKLIEAGDTEFADLQINEDQLAAIVFTSGTSGTQKGVMLSHGNLVSDVVATMSFVYSNDTVIYLPFHHTFVWTAGFFTVFFDHKEGHICSNMKRLSKDLQKHSPVGLAVVPMVAELLYRNIWNGAKKQGKEKKLRLALRLSRFLMAIGIDVRRKLFKDVIDNLGGRLETIVSGGAAIDPEIEQGLYDLGFNIADGYGITECSPVVAVNRIHDFRFGSVGKPIPCCKVKIADPDENGSGEILVSGSNVMKGYYKDEEATREAFAGEWFKTGDYGYLDQDGFLFITGRKKNLIILSNGENISPEELESKLLHISYVSEVVVYEENGKITAEFYLDEENYPDARRILDEDIERFNMSQPLSKNIGKVKVRDIPFAKTTTMKIKRYLIDKEKGEAENE